MNILAPYRLGPSHFLAAVMATVAVAGAGCSGAPRSAPPEAATRDEAVATLDSPCASATVLQEAGACPPVPLESPGCAPAGCAPGLFCSEDETCDELVSAEGERCVYERCAFGLHCGTGTDYVCRATAVAPPADAAGGGCATR